METHGPDLRTHGVPDLGHAPGEASLPLRAIPDHSSQHLLAFQVRNQHRQVPSCRPEAAHPGQDGTEPSVPSCRPPLSMHGGLGARWAPGRTQREDVGFSRSLHPSG